MKSKKGFTLVELLAVIAILAILVVIALPNVVDMFQGAKKGTFKTEVQTLLKQAQQTWVLNGGVGITFYSKCGSAVTTGNTSAKLSMQGNDMNYVIKLNAEGSITYFAISDASYSIQMGNKTLATAPAIAITSIGDSNIFSSANTTENTSYGTFNTAANIDCGE